MRDERGRRGRYAGGRGRERQRETERDTERHRERQTDRQTDDALRKEGSGERLGCVP